jgi:GT2 family glycosyltransferase
MRLSVIIVNYNVCYFLEQALRSVRRAMEGIEGDVWVVDNNSVDDSVAMVREKFPEVHLIANSDNPGFSVANNQAIRASKGDYVLLLNPDTLLEEDTLRRCLEFMDATPDAGAVGVRLIDGSGKYLPESKRGFPTPWVSFCKTVGLGALLPRSRYFNGYYMGHLSPQETNAVDVLVGAFMFIRRAALDKAGLLDEAFFMYGEDIDLSYRIVQAGYQNYYLPTTQIIHYKGESTKKGSLNYVRAFYQAMIIFVRKHFSGPNAGLFVAMLQVAIWVRAALTVVSSVVRKLWLPLLDGAVMLLGLTVMRDFWAQYFYQDPGYFKPELTTFNFPLYLLVWLATVWLTGGYDNRYDLRRLIRGLVIGTILLAAIYGFLDQMYRPSRAHLILSAVWAVGGTTLIRWLLHFAEYRNLRMGQERPKNLLLIGSEAECDRAVHLLAQANVRKNIVDRSPSLARLDELVRVFRVEEIIFCSKDFRAQDILAWMTRLGPHIAYKILPEESLSIIGSSSKDEPGELYTIDIRYAIAAPRQRRNKRIIDLGVSVGLLVTAPIWLVLSKQRHTVASNWLSVLAGRITWVGYAPDKAAATLPRLQPAVWGLQAGLRPPLPPDNVLARLNVLYAKDWTIWHDLEVIWRAIVG